MATFFGKLLSEIIDLFGSIFRHVIDGAEKTFKELPKATQEALINGSGIMDIIKGMLDALPSEVIAAINQKYPNVDVSSLETGLFTIAHAFGLAPKDNDLNDVISQLQTYLKNVTDNTVWDSIFHTASLVLATVLSPKGTLFGALAQLIEYVYQTYFSKKK